MVPGTPPRGTKHDSKKKGKKPKIQEHESSSEISLDLKSDMSGIHYNDDFDAKANFELLKRHFEAVLDQKILLVQTKFQGEVDALQNVIKNKSK